MKNKGFTLVELIAVVVVLGIIAIIAIPAVSKYMYAADDEFYTATENSILASGRDYFSDYTSLLPKQDGDVVSIDVNNELVDGGYIDPIKNNDDEVCNGTLYVTKITNNDYKYCVIIKCGDKVKGNTCGDTPPDIPTKDYTIINDGNRTLEQCSTYNDLLNMVDNKFKHNNKIVGKLIRTGDSTETPLQNNGADILIYPNETNLNLNAIGRYKLIYEYNGAASTDANIDVIDVEGPNKSELKITFNKSTKDGTAYSCDNDSCAWSNKNIVITFVGKDLTTKNTCNQPGSGIANFMYKLEGVTTGNATLNTEWRVVTAFRTGPGAYAGYVKVPENEFKGKIYYNAIDAKGNYAYASSSTPNRYLKIDTIKPTVSMIAKRQDNSAEVASETWVNSKLKFEFTETSGISGYKTYYCFDTNNSCTPSASSTLVNNSAMSRDDVGSYYIRYITISNANTKSTSSSYNGRVDLINPTCVSSGGVSDWVNRNVTLTGTCSDTGGSGCTGNATQTWSTNGTNLTGQGPGTVYDNAGNSVLCPKNQTVKIDKGAPTCGTNNGTTTWGNGSRNVTVSCSDDYSGCTNTYYTNSFGGNIKMGYITIADEAGNTSPCEVPVYLDNTAPTASHSSDAWGAKIKCSDSGGSGLKSGGASISFNYSADSAFIETTCIDNAGNSKYASKTYYHKYKGDIRCYHWSCSGIGGTVSGSQCVKDPTYSGTCTCWQQELTNGAYFWVSSYVDFSGLATSDCNVACINKAYHHGNGTLSADCGSWTLDGSTCKTNATRVDEWQVCTKDNYGAPYQACPHIYADDTCEAYWE